MATHCKDYDFRQIEPHWQTFWQEKHSFRADNGSPKPKYYVLDMFPYPSGAGLHIGHPEGYTATDIVARYKRARGYNVLHPMGWDAFGLPAEQHAVKTGTHPAANTQSNVTNIRRQIKALGFSYDWEREIDTTDPKYFRWTQWIFLQLFKKGLAYVDERPVWWCPELRTVLANEEIVDGKSEVGGFPVERRNLRQWVLRITAYAEQLLDGLKEVDWPESTKRMQEAWIGRSEGAEVRFMLEDPALGDLKVFTTRPDTLFGCTYMVLAPEHPLVPALTQEAQRSAVEAYRRATAAKSDVERMSEAAKEKSGVFTGSHAINPVNGARVPVWIADYVLMGYGTGAIMAVPAEDERDWEFAKLYDLPIIRTVQPPADFTGGAYTGDGPAINSAHGDLSLNGLPIDAAKAKIIAWLESKNAGARRINYKLRDWLFSRQRYWGEPFPIVWVNAADYQRATVLRPDLPTQPVTYDEGGHTHFALPLPEGALPLELPEVVSYLPSGTGESPLANVTAWLEIWFNVTTGAAVPANQPQPAGASWMRARRETNTMPQWAGSCWYYLRFLDPQNPGAIASPAAMQYWDVPDLYVGGAEHAVLHLLYARFWHKVLFELGIVPQAEPFRKLFHQGIILGEDGVKMSKSRGNVVNPDEIIRSYGTDSLRLYLMFLGPLEAMKPWNPKGIEGVHRFLQKVWRECLDPEGELNCKVDDATVDPPELLKLLHETIRKVGDDIDGLRFNTAISQMMIFMNAVQKTPQVNRQTMLSFLQLLAPFAPHIAEELWSRLGGSGSVGQASWPAYDAQLLANTTVKLVYQVNGKHRGDQLVPANITQDEAFAMATVHERVTPHLLGKSVQRIIFVPKKILNIVVK
jgi:leucyl-tRNA synthetase